jgi:ATP/maltotriose-dependent transcriptional regulator MalT
VRLIARCAGIEHLLGRHDEAHRRLRTTLDSLAGAATDERLTLTVGLGVSAFYRLDIEDMLAWGARALEEGAAEGRPAHAAAGAGLVGMGEAFVGRTAQARTACDEGARWMAAAGDEQLAGCLAAGEFLGLAEMYVDRFDEAVAHAFRAIAVARATGQGERIPVLSVSGGFSAAMLGRLAEASAMLDSAVEGARQVDSQFGLAWVLMNAASVKWMAGEYVAARREAVEVAERLKAMDDSMLTANTSTPVAQIELDDGDHRLGARLLLEAGGGPGMPLIGGFWRVFVLESLTCAELAGGRADAARAAAELAMQIAPAFGLDSTLAVARRALALAELDAGRPEAAADLALASASGAATVGAHLEAAKSLAVAGRALAGAGRRDDGLARLREAVRIFEACGARRRAEPVLETLHRLGEVRRPTPRGDALGGLAALTGRETEIAELVWDRRTNREIGEALFLSTKTVESHLRNIFAKVGVSSRVELARAVERSRISVT